MTLAERSEVERGSGSTSLAQAWKPKSTDGEFVLPYSPPPGYPSPISLQQWLKHWEDLFDNQAIALSGRMNAANL